MINIGCLRAMLVGCSRAICFVPKLEQNPINGELWWTIWFLYFRDNLGVRRCIRVSVFPMTNTTIQADDIKLV